MRQFIPSVCFLSILLYNSCSDPIIDIDKLENVCTYSKTLSLSDSTRANSLDLLIQTNSQELLDQYNNSSVSLKISYLQTDSIQNKKSAMVNYETIEEPASEDYIEFVVKNEVFDEKVADYCIKIDIDLNKGLNKKWIQHSWKVAYDCFDILCFTPKVYCKSKYKKDGKWNTNDELVLVKSGTLNSIFHEKSDSLEVIITYKDSDCFELYFYN